MKKGFCLILMTVMFFSGAFAAAEGRRKLTHEDCLQAALAQYPNWTVFKSERFSTGSRNDGFQEYCILKLYRIENHRIEWMELTAIMNNLYEGDTISWEKTPGAPVEIVPGQEKNLKAMASEQIFSYGAEACFSDQVLDMLMPSLTDENESLYQLMACPHRLIAIVQNEADEYFLRIAEWDGAAYQILSTPAQKSLFFNQIHSSEIWIEISFGDLEGVIRLEEDGNWRISTINTGSEIFSIEKDYIIDTTYRGLDQTNDCFLYGRPTFETDMVNLHLDRLPSDIQSMQQCMDYSQAVCTTHDETPIYAKPDGEVLALCYTRVPGILLSQTDAWFEMQLGSKEQGLTVWAKKEDFAFGRQTDAVPCTFPSFDVTDGPAVATKLDGNVVQFDRYEDAPWLIGKTPEGKWLIMLNGEGAKKGMICTADEQTFENVRPTEHDEWYNEEDWNEGDLSISYYIQ
mgnify:CR=1 FL=1